MKLAFVLSSVLLAALAPAQLTKKPPAKNPTRGTSQMAGGYVKFGETYTLKNGVNFAILKAAYTMEAFPSYGGLQNRPGDKLVVLDVAVKNWTKADLDLGGVGGDFITLVDSTGAKYTGEAQLKSHGVKSTYLTLKPGQGVGQPGLADPYRVGFLVPLDADVRTIIVAQPRLGKSEQILRYSVAGADKDSDPANVIAPLPPEVRDPANKSGAVALKAGIAKTGTALPAGPFAYTIVKGESVTMPLDEKYTPAEGKRYLVVTLRIDNASLSEQSYFEGEPRDAVVKDADGESYPLAAVLRATSPEAPAQGPISAGEGKTIRLLFEVPKAAKLASLTLAGSYYPWKLDLTGM